MVLARHEHTPARALEHGMVRAAVAERELERLVSGGKGEKLVPQADAENRDVADELADDLDLPGKWLRVSRPIREHDAVEPQQLLRRLAGAGSTACSRSPRRQSARAPRPRRRTVARWRPRPRARARSSAPAHAPPKPPARPTPPRRRRRPAARPPARAATPTGPRRPRSCRPSGP